MQFAKCRMKRAMTKGTKVDTSAVVLLSLLLYIKVSVLLTFECSTYMTSTCQNNKITKWNHKNIEDNLKEWITSVSVTHLNDSEAMKWKNQGIDSRGKHCKTIAVKRNEFFYRYAPEIYSPNITVLGKLSHEDDGKNPLLKRFVGPVWADINDQYEWVIDTREGGTSGLSNDAVLHNGLYYGVLDNDYMKIGK